MIRNLQEYNLNNLNTLSKKTLYAYCEILRLDISPSECKKNLKKKIRKFESKDPLRKRFECRNL